MEIEYTLNREDYVTYWLRFWEQSPEARRPYLLWSSAYAVVWALISVASLLVALILAAIYWVVATAIVQEPLDIHQFPLTAMWCIAVALLVLCSIAVVGGAFTEGSGRTNQRRKYEKLFDEHLAAGTIRIPRNDRVCLNADGFSEVTHYRCDNGGVVIDEHKRTWVPWQAVQGIERTPRHVIVAVGGNGYLIVPTRAFPSEAACSAFVEAATNYKREAEKAPTRGFPPAPEFAGAIQTAESLWPR
jgi:hypothetical protein